MFAKSVLRPLGTVDTYRQLNIGDIVRFFGTVDTYRLFRSRATYRVFGTGEFQCCLA
jgi:hypothetical protein